MNEYIVSIDQSTSGTKALLINRRGVPICRYDCPHTQIVNALGWTEHDPYEIWNCVCNTVSGVIKSSGIDASDICALSISNQRETAVCWRRSTGMPICNAITWQCSRASCITDKLASSHIKETVLAITGLHLSPYFSAAKFAWILENIAEAAQAAAQNDICFGTIDSWLIYCLTSGKEFKTDISNASRTQLLDLDTLEWSPEMLSLFGLDSVWLPELCGSNGCFGFTTVSGILPNPVPICGVLGDSQAALLGNGCISTGGAKITLGTGTSVMVNSGSVRKHPSGGIVESVAWKLNDSLCYALEGNINYTGALIVWLRDKMKLITKSNEVGPIAAALEDNGGVYLVPSFTGLGSPYWKSNARAIICGLGPASSREHIIRAAEEAIAYQILDIYIELCSVCGEIPVLYADGGAKYDKFLMQFIADMLCCQVCPSEVEELSAIGAGYAAMLYLGWTGQEQLLRQRQYETYSPNMDPRKRDSNYSGWKRSIAMLL